VKRSPEALSAEFLKSQGYFTDRCTWWDSFSHRRKDLFSFADLIAFDPKSGAVILVQATSWSAISTRRNKILGSTVAKEWVAQHPRSIWIFGWKKSKRGWKARSEPEYVKKVIDVRLADFFDAELGEPTAALP
jgi:hypothetical protein